MNTTTLSQAPSVEVRTHATTPPIAPREFVTFLKDCARGVRDVGAEGPIGAFVQAYLSAQDPTEDAPKVDPSECKRVREELREELRVNLKEILRSRPGDEVTMGDRVLAHEARRISAEIFVALTAGKEPIPHKDDFGLADLFHRGEEARFIGQDDFIAALRLAFNRFETLCRGHAPDKIGVSAVEKGLKNSPFGSDLLAKLGSGFFQAHRNDLLHARGDESRDLAMNDINHCITFLMSRVSPVGIFEDLSDPIWSSRGIEEALNARRGPFQRRIEEREPSLITDEVLDRLVRDRALGKVQEWVDEGIMDLSNPEDRDLARVAISVEQVIPPQELFDFRIKTALSLARESASMAIARAGLTPKAGEDPLRFLFGKEKGAFFGSSEDRSKGWGVIMKELLRTEKEGGYFASGRPDVMAGIAAETTVDGKDIDPAMLQRMAMERESDFVVALCATLAHDLDSLTFQKAKPDNAPSVDASLALEKLRKDIVKDLTDNSSTPARAILDFSLVMEERFTELADKFVPRWRDTRPSGVALEAHARDEFFKNPQVCENFKRMGVSEEDLPKVAELVNALFFTVKTSWVHNATVRPTAGDVAHILQAAQLLNELTLVAEGETPMPRSLRTHWEIADLAEAASLHSHVFTPISMAIVGDKTNSKVSNHLDKCMRHESLREVSKTTDSVSGDGKVDYFAKHAKALSEGLAALQGTEILPEAETTAGVLSRGAMLSLLRRLKYGLRCDPDFPLWQVYCEAPDSH